MGYRYGRIGRMAALPVWCNRGVASALLQEVTTRSRQIRTATPSLHAPISVLSFCHRIGFEIEGEEFLEVGISHRRMVRDQHHGHRVGFD